CYISPDDENVQVRITSDVMYGNIIEDLTTQEPSLVGAKEMRFAATASELQALLRSASQSRPDRLTVVIVDGLDHISRVAREATSVTRAQTTIIEDLASLDWPDGTCLVVGSQPGEHLTALVGPGVESVEMPPLQRHELEVMSGRLGLDAAAATVGDDLNTLRTLLTERSEGNALYATMLIKGGVAASHRGVTPVDFLSGTPEVQGDLNRYYGHLYGRLSSGGRQIADLLGAIDFAITEEDLRSIVGVFTARAIPNALEELAPLLITVAGKGGIRIFHESFRRYVIERDPDPKQTMRQLLGPIIAWLTGAGFFESGRSFRFLPSCLARANRLDELFSIVSPNFVSDAIAHCHSRPEIERNLEFASSVAAASQRFPELVRLTQLKRAAYTCFEEHMLKVEPYWEAHLALYGAASTAARLAPDGVPTVGRNEGLRLCSLVADKGGNAPWSAYLSLPPADFDDRYAPDGGASNIADSFGAKMHGLACTKGLEAALRWANGPLGEPTLPLVAVSGIATRWARLDHQGLLDHLQRQTDVSPLFVELALS
ncbi:MAG: hypothetical protein HN396_18940, partial [Gemmatimonadales bacterium]|nr:hypothetical protein [Gemmatimonadales bacterium]